MLNRNARLTSLDNIAEISKKGEKIESPLLIARVRPGEHERTRFAIVLSRKLEKSAVKRNRLRRQIYETIRLLEKEGAVPSKKSFDIVLFARKALLKENFSGIKKAVLQTLNQIYGR